MGPLMSPDLALSDEKSLSPHTTEQSDSGNKTAWSRRGGSSSDHGQHGSETLSSKEDQRVPRPNSREEQRGARGRSPFTVYLGNLAYECDVEDVKEFFQKHSVKVCVSRFYGYMVYVYGSCMVTLLCLCHVLCFYGY